MFLLKNARILDINHRDDDGRYNVLVDGDRIREISSSPIQAKDARIIDVAGRTLMPGMIDCHTHVMASNANLSANALLPAIFAALRAVPILSAMLKRGFTTVRDAGGADYALVRAVQDGTIAGPRLFISGKALSQTGGHGDFRERDDNSNPDPCPCQRNLGAIARIADGVDAVRKAVREEIRAGANQIKIMASGGVASPTDPIGNHQYSRDEIAAIVEEAQNHQTYVMAHAYTASAIERAVELGVRTIEHGNLVDDNAAQIMARHGAFAVPTLATYDALHKVGAQYGVPPASISKIDTVRLKGLESLEIFQRHGVRMGLGSDLLGEMQAFQSNELLLRTQVLDPFDVICQATAIGAQIVNMEGQLGVVSENALADLLIVDGDPVADISLLAGQGEHISMVMKNGAPAHLR